MNARALPWLFSTLITCVPATFAAERITLENGVGAKTEQHPSAIVINQTMMEESQLTAKAGPIFTEGGDYSGITLPYLILQPKPIKYPRWAIREGWYGRMVIAVEILLDGKVGRYKVMKSTGYRMLDDIATSAVRSWEFYPALKNGKPFSTCIEIPVSFQLEEE